MCFEICISWKQRIVSTGSGVVCIENNQDGRIERIHYAIETTFPPMKENTSRPTPSNQKNPRFAFELLLRQSLVIGLL